MMKRLLPLLLLLMAVVQSTQAQEPYAVLSNDNTTLTFYYDTNKASRNGMSVGPFEKASKRGWDNVSSSITTVVFDSNFANCTSITSTAYWFSDCYNVTSITGIENLNTSNVTNMSSMFLDCFGLTSLNVGNFDTSKVTDMSYMFYLSMEVIVLDWSYSSITTDMLYNDSGLTNLDLSNFDTSNVTNMSEMFYGCSCLTNLDVSNFNTSNVMSMSGMFSGCSGLTSLNVGNFDTSKVTSMSGMFSGCSGLTSLDVSNFCTSNVTYMREMFWGCSGLTSLDVSNFDTSKVTNMSGMFFGCSGLTSLDVNNFDTSKVTDMSYMFRGCSKLNTIYCENSWQCNYSDYMFEDCTSLKGAIAYDKNNSNGTYANPITGYFSFYPEPYAVLSNDNTTLTFYYDNNKTSRNGMSVGPFKYYTDRGWDANAKDIMVVVFDDSFTNCTSIFSTAVWFSNCKSLTSIDLTNLNTTNVTSMRSMFKYCYGLTSLDLSNFDTSNVTDMGDMFSGCSGLTSLDVSNFDTSNVTVMSSMFSECSSLTCLDVSSFNTSNVTNMNGLFAGCSKLTSLDVSNYNTSKVTDMSWMFSGCRKLTSLDLGNFDTSNVTNMRSMFSSCSGLTNLNLSNFDTSNVTNMSYMFSGYSGQASLDLSNFDTSNVTNMSYMFSGYSGQASLDLTNLNTSNVTSMRAMFYNCSGLTSLDLSNFNTSNVTNMSEMFYYSSGLTSLDLSNFNTSNVTDMSSMFKYCSGLTSLDMGNFNTSNVTNMSEMFLYCSGLTSLDVGNFNTSNVVNLNGMFEGCSGLTNLDVSNFDTSNVTDMGLMFAVCSGLTSLDVSNFDTSNVVNMDGMFDDCSGLTNLDVSNFDTSNVTVTKFMFSDCYNLSVLSFGDRFNTGNVTNSYSSFGLCRSLSMVKFTGDIPSSMKSDFFSGVGQYGSVSLVVPEPYLQNYQAKFVNGKFYGGIFTLVSDGQTVPDDPIVEPSTPTFNGKRLLSISQTRGNSTRIGKLEYDDNGRVTKYTISQDGKNTIYNYAYDDNHIEITCEHSSGTDTYNYTLEDGRVKSINCYLAADNATVTSSYVYNGDKQLKEALTVTNNTSQDRTVFNWSGGNPSSMDIYENGVKGISTEYHYNQMASEPLVHALFGFGKGNSIYIDSEFATFSIYPYLGTLPQNLFSSCQVTDFLDDNRVFTYNYEYVTNTQGDVVKVTINDTSYTLEWEGSEGSESSVDASLLPQETTVHIGGSDRMSIHLENENPIIMFEFYMELPEGLHISKDEDDYLDAELNAARADRTHSLVVEQGADGLYHFLCYSSKNKAFTGNDGEILNVSISCDANVAAGVYQGKLRNILMSDQDKNAIELADQPFSIEVVDYILGDVNDDSKINGMDIVEMVTLIMEQSYKKPADLYPVGQPDGVINGMDLVQEVELVMSQSATSNAPAMLAVSAIAPDAQHAVEESNASADKLTVADFTIAPGQTYNMAVGLDNPDNQYIMTEFWMSLPEGVSIATDDYGDFVYEEGDRFDKTHSLTISKEAEGNAYHILIYSSQNKPLKNNTGTLFTLTLQAEAGATLGDYQGRIYNQVFSDVDKNEHNPAEVTFSVTIGEVDTHVVLDELSTSVPTAATNVNVRVMRTINANEWSTICLPFDMTEAQVKTAFGDDVQLKDFTGYDTVEDAEENIVGITVNFVDAAAIEANHPYLIKVPASVSEFTVDGVDIDPEEEPTVSFGFTTGKGSKAVYHPIDFNGTYTANTLVPENDLFLSGNKFWYSTGATSMKAFRAYFEFDDVLTEVDEAVGARIVMSFGSEDGTTGIVDNKREAITSNSWYTLDGRKLDKKPTAKGVYVKEGRKVVIK